MRKPVFVLGLFILFALLVIMSGATPAHATSSNIWLVNAAYPAVCAANHCKTIGAAITAASDGDTIIVTAGTYTGQLNISKGLTIVGDVSNPDNVVIDGQNSTTMLNVGQVRIYNPSGPVVFKGFKIVNTGWNPSDASSIALGILTKSNYPVKIQRNKLIGHGAGLDVGNDYGLWAYGSTGTLTIQDNYLSGMYHGILLERQTGASTIAYNTFDALYTGLLGGVKYGGRAIEAITYGSTDVTSLQEIKGNKFVNFASTGVQFSGGFSGETPSKFTNVVIEENNFDFATTDISNLNGAVYLKNVSTPSNNNPAGGVSANIRNNVVHVPSGNGIFVTGLNGTITINNNSIAGNLYGLMANGSLGSTINATGNWWGAASGPFNATTNPTGTGNAVSANVTYIPFARALTTSTTASTHEIGETGILTTTVTVNGLYGVQLLVTHDPILNWSSGITIPVTAKNWYWDIMQESFVPIATPNGRRLTGLNKFPNVAANLTGDAIAQWNYTCAAQGTSALAYDTTLGAMGTQLSDKDGLPIPSALLGDSITCIANTASVDGYVGLQGRLTGTANPAGWYNSTVLLLCVSGSGCDGYGPYILTTDLNGYYQLVKTGAGTGIATGTYSASVSRRGYLGANKTANVTIATGTNTINASAVPQVPTLLGGDANDDGTINVTDLSTIGLAFGAAPGGGADTGADINGDNIVNIFDLVLGGGNFGLSTSTWP